MRAQKIFVLCLNYINYSSKLTDGLLVVFKTDEDKKLFFVAVDDDLNFTHKNMFQILIVFRISNDKRNKKEEKSQVIFIGAS